MNIDSETPRSARQASRDAPLGERPESTVKMLQIPKLAVTSTRLEYRSPKTPASGEHSPYTHKNRAPVSPTTASLYPNSFCSAGKSVYTTCRSA